MYLSLYLSIYVCMHVCMYACMYACMHHVSMMIVCLVGHMSLPWVDGRWQPEPHREVWWGIWRRVARHDEVDEVWWSMVRFDEMMKCDEAWHFGWGLQVVMDESGGFKLSCWVAKLGGHSCTSCPKKGHPVGRLLLELRRWFRRWKCPGVVIIVILLLLALGGGGVFFFIHRRRNLRLLQEVHEPRQVEIGELRRA